jgi:subtilisin family serine protease
MADKRHVPKGAESLPELSEDGWAIFSGSSAAAAQISGAIAVLRQAHPQLSPSQARELLQASAIDVDRGNSHARFQQEAIAGPDVATGQGVVDVHAALLRCQLWSLTPTAC